MHVMDPKYFYLFPGDLLEWNAFVMPCSACDCDVHKIVSL
jgi:hypothetical protein